MKKDKKVKKYKQSILNYRFAQFCLRLVSLFIFKRKIRKNELKGHKGPCVIIANHQCSLDFASLIGANRRPLAITISGSFYYTLSIKGILKRMGAIPKQQFQSSVKDIKLMKTVVDEGNQLVIYPAGLMSEDGCSTPIPATTYKFLKWLNVDVYVAKVTGTYFTMPKWAKGVRPGRTYLDIYKLFDKEELNNISMPELIERTNAELMFDAYCEQEDLLIKYKNNHVIEGLENVLYQCPHCKSEFVVSVKDKSTIYCKNCGFEETADKYGFLHNNKNLGNEIRHPSDWSKFIYNDLKEKIVKNEISELSSLTKFSMIDYEKRKFFVVGNGKVTLNKDGFLLVGKVNGENFDLKVSIANVASMPFKPGKYFEVQHGDDIYRCVLDDGKLVTKFVNMLEIFYELSLTEPQK